MRILSVDRGDVRTGLAVCDESETVASPVAVLTEYHPERLPRRIADEAKRLSVGHIVVGLPKNMDGTEGESAHKCRELADAISKLCPVPVSLYDERVTTVYAHNILSENNVRGKKRKNTVDAVSAVLILEDFIKSRKNRKEEDK